MDKKLFLTSVVALGFAMPAFAELAPGQEVAELCSTGDYTNSDPNPAQPTDCYRDCSVANMASSTSNPASGSFPYMAHAATFTGRDYYGGHFSDTCEPVTCVAGWHIQPSSSGESGAELRSKIGDATGFVSAYTGTNGIFDYTFDSVAYGSADSSADYATSQSYFYDMSGNEEGLWAVAYGYGKGGFVRGKARLSSVSGTAAGYNVNSGTEISPTLRTTDELGLATGNNCYCTLTGYRPYGVYHQPGAEPWQLLASPWAYNGTSSSLPECAAYCAKVMREGDARSNLAFRHALLNSVTYNSIPATCIEGDLQIPDYSSIECPSGYTADAGATETAQCYKACELVDGAETMKGRDYYGYAGDTCEPDECVRGWHISLGQSVNLDSAIGEGIGESSAYVSDNGTVYSTQGVASEYVSTEYYGMNGDPEPGLWAVVYGPYHGLLLGKARLSDVAGTNGVYSGNPTLKTTEQLGTETGTHCYCGLEKYNPWSDYNNINASPWLKVNSSWAYWGSVNSLEICADYCSQAMQNNENTSSDRAFRHALLGSASASYPAKCIANTISVTWKGTSAAEVNANNAGTITYGGDVRTPKSADVISGKIFKGWQFKAPESTD